MSKDTKVTEDGTVKAALATLKKEDSGPARYLVVGYAQGSTTSLVVIAEGEGGLDEAAKSLPDDEPRYLLIRKDLTVDNRAKTVKVAYIAWEPTSMKTKLRVTIQGARQAVQAILKPYHVELQWSDRSDVAGGAKEIDDKIGLASGTANKTGDKKTDDSKKDDSKKDEKKDDSKKDEKKIDDVTIFNE